MTQLVANMESGCEVMGVASHVSAFDALSVPKMSGVAKMLERASHLARQDACKHLCTDPITFKKDLEKQFKVPMVLLVFLPDVCKRVSAFHATAVAIARIEKVESFYPETGRSVVSVVSGYLESLAGIDITFLDSASSVCTAFTL